MGRLERIIGTNIITTPQREEIRLGHTWHEVEVLEAIVEREHPRFFVEIGIHEGGLAYLLLPKLKETYYIGVDNFRDYIRPEVWGVLAKSKGEIRICDCFDQELMFYLACLRGKVIYCDGGNKVEEVKRFRDICHPGDMIFCHDYWDGKRVVREVPKGQVHVEVRPEDVAHMSEGFEPYSESYLRETRIAGWRKL